MTLVLLLSAMIVGTASETMMASVIRAVVIRDTPVAIVSTILAPAVNVMTVGLAYGTVMARIIRVIVTKVFRATNVRLILVCL